MSDDRESTTPDISEYAGSELSPETRRDLVARASAEGAITLLFTDVVESTRIRQHLGDEAAQERFRQHNHVVRAQIEKHNGFEVKTQGDGFMVAFRDAGEAMGCSIDIQRAIAEDNEQHPDVRIQLRIGLNCGQVLREEDDFFGGPVVVAARLAELAKGGQILVSEAVRVLAGLPQGVGYVRYGRRRLKGLAGTYDVWSVPWREGEPEGLRMTWSRSIVLRAALLVVPVAAVGGLAGWLFLDWGASGQQAIVQDLALHIELQANQIRMTGTCQSGDLGFAGNADGTVSGDVGGLISGTFQVMSSEEECLVSPDTFILATLTLADEAGNTLIVSLTGPVSFVGTSPNARGGAFSDISLDILGGTGMYEEATGSGACSGVLIGEIFPIGLVVGDESVPLEINASVRADCTGEMATGRQG